MIVNLWLLLHFECAFLPVGMCLYVCVSVFSILPSYTFRHPMRGISGYSAGNVVKLKRYFL